MTTDAERKASSNPIELAVQEQDSRRIEALRERGFTGWLSLFETQAVFSPITPRLTEKEGYLCAQHFGNLVELDPVQPTKSTETPIMEAIQADLEAVFGNSVIDRINVFVVTELMPLRGNKEKQGDKPNKYLAIATENVLRDIVAVARTHQMTDEKLRELYPDTDPNEMRRSSLASLQLSLFARANKGWERARGHCENVMHQEHIWILRGFRDVPPGGLTAIGGLIDSLLQEREQ
jgi:hypothetical protein